MIGKRPTLLAAVVALSMGFARESAAAGHGDGPTIPMPGKIAGKVIHVDDGDTLIVMDGAGYKRVIRLTDIDAPETSHGAARPGQPYSAKATQQMKTMALGHQASAECYDIDARARADGTTRERYVCRVFVDGIDVNMAMIDVNMAMIDAGLAMAYRQNKRYVRSVETYRHEDIARQAGKGLWAQTTPTPPWEWRRACWDRQQCQGAGD